MKLSKEIIDEFNRSFKKARISGEPEPTAMIVATSDGKGLVTSRTVLLKALDENGFVFFTNYKSRKAREMDEKRHDGHEIDPEDDGPQIA